MTPPLVAFERDGMHRLIPSRYSPQGTVLAGIADDARVLEDIVLLDGATNDRIQGEQHGLAGINPYELVYGVPNWHIVNAAFTHASQDGSRFSGSTRGAWYVADELETALAEVAYHKAKRLADIIVPELPDQRPDHEAATYDDWLADFKAEFHVLEPAENYATYLKAGPVPACYVESQQFARQLLNQKSNGVVYPSVRRAGFFCLACFRPALVYNPRRGDRVELSFQSAADGYTYTVRNVPD
jgi:RES domain-containing protein